MTRARDISKLSSLVAFDTNNVARNGNVTVSSSGSVTLGLTGSNTFFDAGTLTGASTVTFGTPDETVKTFTYSFMSGYDNSASSIDDVDTWVYDRDSQFDGYNPSEGMLFNNDGTKAFLLDSSMDGIVGMNLSIPYYINSGKPELGNKIHLSAGTIASVGQSVGTPLGPGTIGSGYTMQWNNDGTRFYIVDASTDAVHQWDLSTAYYIHPSTVTYNSSFYVGSFEATPYSVTFKPDGTMMFITGGNGDGVDVFNLSTAWDVTTATWALFKNSGAMGGGTSNYNFNSMFFNSDGTKAYINRLIQASSATLVANLSTPYDFNTATGFGSKWFNAYLHSGPYSNNSYNPVLLPLDRLTHAYDMGCIIERGTSYYPTFATSFSGYPEFYSRGYRHNLTFHTSDTGSSYQLLRHDRVHL